MVLDKRFQNQLKLSDARLVIKLLKKIERIEKWLKEHPWVNSKITAGDLVLVLVTGLVNTSDTSNKKKRVMGRDELGNNKALSPTVRVLKYCPLPTTTGEPDMKKKFKPEVPLNYYSLPTQIVPKGIKKNFRSEVSLYHCKHKPKYCIVREFVPYHPGYHAIKIYCGNNLNKKRQIIIPKTNYPSFVSEDSITRISNFAHMELKEDRQKIIKVTGEARNMLSIEKEKRVAEFRNAKPSNAEDESDLVGMLLESIKEIINEFSDERSRLLRVRQLSDFRAFSQYVQGAKCQVIRELQFKENLIKQRDREEYLKEVIEERYNHIKYLNNKETLLRNEEKCKKKLFLDGLVCKIEELQIKEGPLMRALYNENSVMRNKSHAIRQHRVLHRMLEQQNQNDLWRKEMLACAASIHSINQLENEEERVLNENEEQYLKKKLKYLGEQSQRDCDVLAKKQAYLQLVNEEQLHRKNKQRVIDEIVMIRAQNLVDWAWRKNELKQMEKEAAIHQEMVEGIEKLKNDLFTWRAMEVERDRREAERVTRQNARDYQMSKRQLSDKKSKQIQLRKDIKIQIRAKVLREREDFQIRQKEALNSNVKISAVDRFLNKEMAFELKRLSVDGLPEDYVGSVQRKFKIQT